jgi:hypothetical protein
MNAVRMNIDVTMDCALQTNSGKEVKVRQIVLIDQTKSQMPLILSLVFKIQHFVVKSMLAEHVEIHFHVEMVNVSKNSIIVTMAGIYY